MATGGHSQKNESASAAAASASGAAEELERETISEAIAAAGEKTSLDVKIAELRMKRAALMVQKAETHRNLRNSEKRRARLKRKSTELSTNDLIEVFNLRMKAKARKDKDKA